MQSLFRCGRRYVLILFIAVVSLFCSNNIVHADTERVIRYEYDGAGNIIRVLSQQLDSAPQITELTPAFINIGSSNQYTATGINLFGVDITSNDLGITVTDVQSTKESVTFRVRAGLSASVGNATLIFSNALGQTQQTLAVVEAAPELISRPSPLVIAGDNATTDILLVFSESRPEDETYTIGINDTSIASTATTTFTVLAGQDQINLSITGLTEGLTDLTVRLDAKFAFYSIPVYVGKTFEQLLEENPDMRQRNLFSQTVGIFVRENSLSGSNVVISKPVGISYQTSAGQLLSKPVGVLLTDVTNPVLSTPVGVLVTDIRNPILSAPVGVNVGGITSFAYSLPVETIYGAFITDLQDVTATVDTTVTVDVQGFSLSEVTTVSVSPDTDITVDSFVANAEGTTLTITLTIGLDAVLGQREILIEDANGPVINDTGTPLTFEIQ